jgi:tetratricopeptide (TPR) repeat protein
MGQLALCQRDVAQAREQGDREREAQALIALGKVHQEKGRRKLALDAWREAASLLQALGRDQDLAELYERMAGNCLDMGWTDKSCGY